MAFAARSFDFTAKSSCCSRVMPGGVVLGAEAHQTGVERAPQAVLDDGVGEFGVAVAEAAAGAVGDVRSVRHRLHPAGDDDVGVAGGDHLVGEMVALRPDRQTLLR